MRKYVLVHSLINRNTLYNILINHANMQIAQYHFYYIEHTKSAKH